MSSQHAFLFVQALAEDLNSRQLNLPSFPNVAAQIRNAFHDDNCTAEKLSRIVLRDAKLTACLLKLANSAQYARGGKTVDVPTAINRLGLNTVQNTAMAVAMRQLALEKDYQAISSQLLPLLEHSISVAAFSFSLARQQSGVNPDTALLAGMMHGIGKVYIWSKASSNTELFADAASMNDLLENWHCAVGKSILESWCLPDEVVAAVEHYQHFEDAVSNDHVRMVATLSVANQMAANQDLDALEEVTETQQYKRLALQSETAFDFLKAANEDLQTIRQALAG